MKKYIILFILILPLIVLTYVTAFACIGRKSESVTFYYEKEKGLLYIGNGESGRYISKIKMEPQEDTLCVSVYKRPIIVQRTYKGSASTVWKIKLKETFKYIKSGDRVISIESLKEPPLFDYAIIEIHPKHFPCTLR